MLHARELFPQIALFQSVAWTHVASHVWTFPLNVEMIRELKDLEAAYNVHLNWLPAGLVADNDFISEFPASNDLLENGALKALSLLNGSEFAINVQQSIRADSADFSSATRRAWFELREYSVALCQATSNESGVCSEVRF